MDDGLTHTESYSRRVTTPRTEKENVLDKSQLPVPKELAGPQATSPSQLPVARVFVPVLIRVTCFLLSTVTFPPVLCGAKSQKRFSCVWQLIRVRTNASRALGRASAAAASQILAARVANLDAQAVDRQPYRDGDAEVVAR